MWRKKPSGFLLLKRGRKKNRNSNFRGDSAFFGGKKKKERKGKKERGVLAGKQTGEKDRVSFYDVSIKGKKEMKTSPTSSKEGGGTEVSTGQAIRRKRRGRRGKEDKSKKGTRVDPRRGK